ncbi:beta-1,4-galactosyltransferase 4-like [Sycon ciliatum]|uniref:beta-1,4-galactosyltransferase 4-like n=2 Tax=Sycon ciliatum TaxID=27933 RepID=UPI0031F6E40B
MKAGFADSKPHLLFLESLVFALLGFGIVFTACLLPTKKLSVGEEVKAYIYMAHFERASSNNSDKLSSAAVRASTTTPKPNTSKKLSIETPTAGHNTQQPSSAKKQTREAIVAPFRNRLEQLQQFAPLIHKFLSRQNIQFKVLVIEQLGKANFNRGALLNIGFIEANSGRDREDKFDCMSIHDIDLIPQELNNTYDCKEPPVRKAWQLSSAIDVYDWDLPEAADGGVNLLQSDVYRQANGFNNRFYGWGGEDNDLKLRLVAIGTDFVRRNRTLGRYVAMKKGNIKSKAKSTNRFELLSLYRKFVSEGLTTVKYRVLKRNVQPTYILISVDMWLTEDPDRYSDRRRNVRTS